MYSSAVLIFLVCLLPIAECLPKNGCRTCFLGNGTCVSFGKIWTEFGGAGCFTKQCLQDGQYGWRTSIVSSRCLTENRRCMDIGSKWLSRKADGCVQNTCLARGKIGIQIKIVPIDC